MTLFLLFLMLLLSAFFSGSEIAYVAANKLKVEAKASNYGWAGRIATSFLKDPSTLLTTTLVGNNVALVVYSTLAAVLLHDPIEAFVIANLGMEGSSWLELVILVLQTIVASLAVLIFGEILPKTIFQSIAERAVFAAAIPLKITYFVLFFPFIIIARGAANLLNKILGGSEESNSGYLRRDLLFTIEESSRSGELDLDEDEANLVTNVLELASLRVKESMIPRTEIAAVEETDSIAEVHKEFIQTGYSRLPVYKENIDDIVGMVVARDLFKKPKTLKSITREVRFVPEDKHCKDLLKEFLEERKAMAIVIDEYGGTAGMVTVEDLIEEVTGEIRDEHDREDFSIRKIDDDSFLVSGRAEIDQLSDEFDIELEKGDFETVAGYLLEKLQSIPKADDEFETDDFKFVILTATKNKIEMVKLIKKAKNVDLRTNEANESSNDSKEPQD